MSFLGGTTVFTTEGVKEIKDLVDIPFEAIVDGDLFPCHAGARADKRKDFYQLKTSRGFSILTSFDQYFLSKMGIFKPIQEFDTREEIVVSISPNRYFEADKGYREGLTSTEVIPEIEFYSSGFYKGFFQSLWKSQGYIKTKYLSFSLPDLDVPQITQLQRMFARAGVLTKHLFIPHKIVGLSVERPFVDNYIKFIGFSDDADEQAAYEIMPDVEPPEVVCTKFISLEYLMTDMAYSCEIEGSSAFDANCFYVGDSTHT